MALLAEQLVGRADELGSLELVLDAGGRTGDRQDAASQGAGRSRRGPRSHRPVGIRVRARARPAVLRLRRSRRGEARLGDEDQLTGSPRHDDQQ